MSLISCSSPTFRSVTCNSAVLSNIQLLIPNLQLCGIALFWSSFAPRNITSMSWIVKSVNALSLQNTLKLSYSLKKFL
jgi:hypothetical protein